MAMRHFFLFLILAGLFLGFGLSYAQEAEKGRPPLGIAELEERFKGYAQEARKLDKEWYQIYKAYKDTKEFKELDELKHQYMSKMNELWKKEKEYERAVKTADYEGSGNLLYELGLIKEALDKLYEKIQAKSEETPALRKLSEVDARALEIHSKASGLQSEARRRRGVLDRTKAIGDEIRRLEGLAEEANGKIREYETKIGSERDPERRSQMQANLSKAKQLHSSAKQKIAEARRMRQEMMEEILKITGTRDEVSGKEALEKHLKALAEYYLDVVRTRRDIENRLSALSKVRRERSVIELHGRVEFREEGGVWKSADKPFTVKDGDAIKTGPNSFATIQFENGAKIDLPSMSLFRVEDRTSEQGVWIRVKKGAAHIFGRVKVAVLNIIMAVRGTDYIITVSENETRLIVLEGEVELSSIDGAKKLVLKGMQQALVTEEKFPESASPVTEDEVRELRMKIYQGLL